MLSQAFTVRAELVSHFGSFKIINMVWGVRRVITGIHCEG